MQRVNFLPVTTAAVAGLAWAIDLCSKLLVVAHLEHRAPVEVIGARVELRVSRNAGAAFGMGTAMTYVFTAIAAAVVGVVARLARKLCSTPWAVALGLLLGGALGNLTDRLSRRPAGRGGRLHRRPRLQRDEPGGLGDRLRRGADRAPLAPGLGIERHRST